MNIKWPQSDIEKINLCLSFMIDLFDYLDISFLDYQDNPLLIAKSYLKGEITADDYSKNYELYDSILEEKGSLDDVKTWQLRLCKCLLSVSRSPDELDLLLDWLYECLNMYYLYKHQEFMYDKAIDFYKKWVNLNK